MGPCVGQWGWAGTGQALTGVTKQRPWGNHLKLVAARTVTSKEKRFIFQIPNAGMILASWRGFSKGPLGQPGTGPLGL